MNTIPFKAFFFDNALRFAIMICCAAGIALSGHAQLSQKYAHEIVRGIDIKFLPLIFDTFYSREAITYNKVGVDSHALLKEPDDICSFFSNERAVGEIAVFWGRILPQGIFLVL